MDGSYVLPTTPQLQRKLSHSPASTPTPASPVLATLNLAKPPALSRREQILQAVEEKDVDTLRKMAAEQGGFENSELRQLVWPLLLGCSDKGKGKAEQLTPNGDGASSSRPESPSEASTELPPHDDERQVRLDVIRSFVNYPADITSEAKEVLRTKLETIIVTTLRRHPSLQYFQGYHDIISVLLLTLEDEELSLAAAERMSLHRLRDSMGSGLEPVLGYLRLVHRILAKVDPSIAEVVELAAELPYFSLSWVITLMSHDLTSINVIARLFDFLLAHNPAMISYVGVAIILLKKDELASLDEDSADDPAILHHTLSKLPSFIETPDSPLSPPTPTTPTTEAPDEDLMSSSASTATLSTLTDSTASLSSLDLSLDLSLEAMDDSLFTDPDVYSPGLYSSPPRAPALRQSQPSPPSSPAAPPPSSVDDLITRALELYTLYPLIGDDGGEKGEHIAADEVMGPKSCVFTWPLSVEGRLSDEGADEIARKGVDIVLPVPVLGASKEGEEEVIAEKVEERRRKLMAMKRRRRKVEVGVGAVLAVVGVAGVLMAVYGAEWRTLGKEASGGRWDFSRVWR